MNIAATKLLIGASMALSIVAKANVTKYLLDYGIASLLFKINGIPTPIK